MPAYKPATPENFWKDVDKSGGPNACWPWLKCKERHGYGHAYWDRQHHRAHRLAFELATGIKPVNCVLHKCDNPPCCNPAHLFEGTQKDNALDKQRKGRGNQPRGERN